MQENSSDTLAQWPFKGVSPHPVQGTVCHNSPRPWMIVYADANHIRLASEGMKDKLFSTDTVQNGLQQ